MESRKPTFVPVARLLGASQSRPNLPRADLQARPAHSCSGHHDPFLSTKRRASDVYDGRLILHGSRSRKKRSATSTWTCRSNRFRLAFPLWSGPSSSTCGSRAFSSFPSIFVLRSASLTLEEACKLRVARIVSTRRRPTGVGSRGDPRTPPIDTLGIGLDTKRGIDLDRNRDLFRMGDPMGIESPGDSMGWEWESPAQDTRVAWWKETDALVDAPTVS